MEIITEIKTCTKCLVKKGVFEFSMKGKNRRTQCKKCCSEAGKEYRKRPSQVVISKFKTCTKCFVKKQVIEFSMNGTSRRPECKNCGLGARKEYQRKLSQRCQDEIIIQEFKECTKCFKTKESKFFSQSLKIKKILENHCKECKLQASKIYQRKLSKRSPDEIPNVEFKKCPKCLETKGFNFFHKLSSTKYGLNVNCIECSSKISKTRNQKVQKYRDDKRSSVGCNHCGETDADMLSNNHIDPLNKIDNISSLQSIKKIDEEWVWKKFLSFHYFRSKQKFFVCVVTNLLQSNNKMRKKYRSKILCVQIIE